MKIAIIFLDYLRHEHSKQTLISLVNAGHPFDLFTIQEKGISLAINKGIDLTRNYDAIVTCANDIEMPENWLKMMSEYICAIDNTGMCGIHCVEGNGIRESINGKLIDKVFTAFGNVIITRKAIDAIGYFNEDYDPYGMQDSDYAYRLNALGFINYYIPDMLSKHIGHDVGQDTDYRRMKDKGLSVAGDKWNKWTKYYDETKNYKL
jgi:GT2 family glycosyltransferase